MFFRFHLVRCLCCFFCPWMIYLKVCALFCHNVAIQLLHSFQCQSFTLRFLFCIHFSCSRSFLLMFSFLYLSIGLHPVAFWSTFLLTPIIIMCALTFENYYLISSVTQGHLSCKVDLVSHLIYFSLCCLNDLTSYCLEQQGTKLITFINCDASCDAYTCRRKQKLRKLYIFKIPKRGKATLFD